MRIHHYVAHLLSSSTVAPSSPPRPPAASWLHTDNCCALCELSRPAPQVTRSIPFSLLLLWSGGMLDPVLGPNLASGDGERRRSQSWGGAATSSEVRRRGGSLVRPRDGAVRSDPEHGGIVGRRRRGRVVAAIAPRNKARIVERARNLLSRLSKVLVRLQALKKPRDLICKQRISEILRDESWKFEVDIPEEVLALTNGANESRRISRFYSCHWINM